MTSETSVRLVIRGRVQGVGFRYALQREALARGLAGWVRNRRDGSVEAVFAGPAETVAAMIEACRHGPGSARVDAVDESVASSDDVEERYPGELFSMLPTS